MTNNELSRKVLEVLVKGEGGVKFKELTGTLGADARAVFKNLFFLEEQGYVQLSTRDSSDTVYPQILMVRLRGRGRELFEDREKLDSVFPLTDSSMDEKPHMPPEIKPGRRMTFQDALDLLAERVREQMEGEEMESTLEKIESLLALPFAKEKIRRQPSGG